MNRVWSKGSLHSCGQAGRIQTQSDVVTKAKATHIGNGDRVSRRTALAGALSGRVGVGREISQVKMHNDRVLEATGMGAGNRERIHGDRSAWVSRNC